MAEFRNPTSAVGRFRTNRGVQLGPVTAAKPGRDGPVSRRRGPDVVRYMSVHSRTQPDSQGHDGTPSRQKATAREAG
jgi:hypothetical protein